MGRPKFYRNTRVNVIKIFRFLKKCEEEGMGYLTVGEISRGTGLHKWIVSRTIDLWMQHVVDVVIPERLEDVGLRIKLVKLKSPNITEQQVLRGLVVRL
ncbi:MAG TPA: hypothetical protein ENG00_01605 [Candidatus Aenigmarchaeota archaeon]|nr:hypothetical protein [Candidatus Aenigmarchaeota archaeon]